MLVLAVWANGAASAQDWTEAWSGSRWHVQVEETTPVPIELSAVQNLSFRTRAVQWDAVLACGGVTPIGKKSVEIDCAFEALAMHATPRSLDGAAPSDHEVLKDMVARLSSTTVRLGLTRDGRLVSVDLPLLEANNRRESESREVLRLLVSDLVAPFHLRRPEVLGETWEEKGSELLRAPTQSVSMGTSRIDHTLTVQDGHRIVQSVGEGTFSTPFEPWQFSVANQLPQRLGAGPSTKRAAEEKPATAPDSMVLQPLNPTASDERLQPTVAPAATTPTDVLFTGSLVSVVVLGEDDWPTERVWAMTAGPTSGSVGSLDGTNVWYAGHLTRLAPEELVDVGRTSVVAPPGASVPGLDPWVPLETL